MRKNLDFWEIKYFFGGNFLPIFFIQNSIVVQISKIMITNFNWTGRLRYVVIIYKHCERTDTFGELFNITLD